MKRKISVYPSSNRCSRSLLFQFYIESPFSPLVLFFFSCHLTHSHSIYPRELNRRAVPPVMALAFANYPKVDLVTLLAGIRHPDNRALALGPSLAHSRHDFPHFCTILSTIHTRYKRPKSFGSSMQQDGGTCIQAQSRTREDRREIPNSKILGRDSGGLTGGK